MIFRLGISSRLQPSALASSQYPACPECPPHWKAPNETCLSLEDLRRSPPGRLKLEHVTLLIPYHGMPFLCEASLEKLCKTGRGERQWNVNPQASRLNLALHSIPRVGSVKIMRIVRKDVMDTAFQLQRSWISQKQSTVKVCSLRPRTKSAVGSSSLPSQCHASLEAIGGWWW